MSDNQPQFGVRLEGDDLTAYQEEVAKKQAQQEKALQEQLALKEKKNTVTPQDLLDALPEVNEPPKTPQEVRFAWWAWALLQIGSTATMLYFLLTRFSELLKQNSEAYAAELSTSGSSLTPEQFSTDMQAFKWVFVVVSILVLLVALFWGYRMFQGRNWARILLTFICAFHVVGLLSIASTFQQSTFSGVQGLISGLIGLAILYWIWFPEASKKYFLHTKAYRFRQKYSPEGQKKN